jgi:germination protein M
MQKRHMIYLGVAVAITIVVLLSTSLFRTPSIPESGEPEGGNAVPSATRNVKVYFMNDRLDPEVTCVKVFPVTREIEDTPGVARAALETLLGGPSAEEEKDGYRTLINPGVVIRSIAIENGIAKVDFDMTLEKEVGGSCRVSAIRAQLTETLMQFPTVKSVILSVEGRVEEALQP